jgi:hypothetical protein
VVSTITKAVIIQLTFIMNPLLIFWLHKYHDKVHNGRQLAIKVIIKMDY